MLTIDDLTVSPHPAAAPVLAGLSLTAAAGEILVVLGDSGCGKTTLLRAIAGLLRPSTGRIAWGGRDLIPLPPADRGVSLIFQTGNAYDHWNVGQHLLHDLKGNSPRGSLTADVGEILRQVDLAAQVDRFPAELSGGQLQRLSIARALASRRPILLMDEPLVHLDVRGKRPLLELVEGLRDPARAIIFVTHDLSDAMRLADRIAILHDGSILQAGTPAELYRRPQTVVAADKLADEPIQLFRESPGGGSLHVVCRDELLGGAGEIMETKETKCADGQLVEVHPPLIGLRPEAIAVSTVETAASLADAVRNEAGRQTGKGSRWAMGGTVARMDFLGPSVRVEICLEGQRPHVVALLPGGEADMLKVGRAVQVSVDLSIGHRFDRLDGSAR